MIHTSSLLMGHISIFYCQHILTNLTKLANGAMSPNLAGASQENGVMFRLLRTRFRVYNLDLKWIKGVVVVLRVRAERLVKPLSQVGCWSCLNFSFYSNIFSLISWGSWVKVSDCRRAPWPCGLMHALSALTWWRRWYKSHRLLIFCWMQKKKDDPAWLEKRKQKAKHADWRWDDRNENWTRTRLVFDVFSLVEYIAQG